MEAGKEKVGGGKWWLTVLVIFVLVGAGSYVSLRREFRSLSLFRRPDKQPVIVGEYADALSIALQFFDVQKCKRVYVFISSSVVEVVCEY